MARVDQPLRGAAAHHASTTAAIALGYPSGPTGIGQIGEIALQLCGDACPRQHAGARTGLAHMVGVGAVCYIHVLQRP